MKQSLGRILLIVAFSLWLSPGIIHAQTATEQSATPPVGQQLVREGDFALRLAASLDIVETDDEVEAETSLGDMGITPRNGWIADYPVTPDILGELQQSVKKAAEAGNLEMETEEALNIFEETKKEVGLNVKPQTAKKKGEKIPEKAPEYPDAAEIDNYYESEGPPIVTYYAPPPDYYYLYSWVPYPFFTFGFGFPGFFVLHDFHRPFRVHNRVRFISNHFNDPRRHRVYRVDPGARFNGRTYAGIGVRSRTRSFIPTGVPSGERRIFNRPGSVPIPGRSYTPAVPRGGGMRAPAGIGGTPRMPSGGGMAPAPSGGSRVPGGRTR
ncbi:hypothetical protein Geob_3177 [Geotalea daltonii FRC-32]|uniref:DUF3300 domain-containing protein n=1 Tax=Geotalea daltonii (strain DSM 22248 / JCM 15807 / FRC-32) TaxID=316067 RepID=B9M465_GEODF|nr:hypothetical protein [Geotalea daltonii]ACM21520.1 hypothetical protein Geob_3177 [Geotalea daltonii FRC-32]